MILFVVPVGNVVGQNSMLTAIPLSISDSMQLNTFSDTGRQDMWFVINNDFNDVLIKISDIIQPKSISPYFEKLVCYKSDGELLLGYDIHNPVFFDTLRAQSTDSIYILLKPTDSAPDIFKFQIAGTLFFPVMFYEYQYLGQGTYSQSAYCIGNPDSGPCYFTNCGPDSMRFTWFYDTYDSGDSYVWFFHGDNGVYIDHPSGPPIPHEYFFAHSGIDTLDVCEYNLNNQAQFCIRIIIKTIERPTPVFSVVPNPVCPSCSATYPVCVENDASEYAFQECDQYWVEWSNPDGLLGPIGQPLCAFYNHVGVENVMVVWQNQCGLDTTIQSFTISNQPDFFADTVCEGNATTMAAFTSCEFNTYTSWVWNFYDGTTGSGQTVSHIFNGAGNHWVTLTVTDACGNTETHSEWINVKPVPQTNAELSFYTNCDTDTITGTIFNPDADCLYNWFAYPSSAVTFISGNTGTSVIFVTNNAALTSPTYIIISTTDSVTGCKGLDTLLFYPCCNIPSDSSWSEENISTSAAYSYAQFQINGTVNFNADQTFTNCMFYFGPMAKITMSPGVEVQFHECALVAGCEYMWDGIYVDSPSESLIMDSCKVRDAVNSVCSFSNGYYSLKQNDFRQNYISLFVKNSEPGFTGVMSDNILYQNSALAYPPHIGSKGFAGVKAYHAASVNIGPGNEFDKLFNGIWAEKSQLIVKGNQFNNINTITVFNVSTGAVYMDGGYSSNYSFIYPTSVVGGANAADGNTFQNCLNGVVAKNPQRFEILNNDFSRITNRAISYSFLKKACVAEIRNNSFTNCATGVYAYLNTNCNSTIANNTMNWTGNPLSATGIRVLGDKFENERYYILSNTISKPKYGIDIQTTYGTLVQDNTIEDLRSNSGSLKYYGIRSLNCYKPVISSNTITPVPFNINQPSTNSDINIGIKIENTANAKVTCNIVRKAGTGLHVAGVNTASTIWDNDFVRSYKGISVTNGGSLGIQGSLNRPSDNQWMNMSTASGSAQCMADGTASQSVLFVRTNPVSYNPIIQGPFVKNYCFNNLPILLCPTAIDDDPNSVKYSISEEIPAQSLESRGWSKKGIAKIIHQHSDWVATDSTIAIFIDSLVAKPVILFDSVLTLRENEDFSLAELLNQTIVPDIQMDELEKEVNGYYLILDNQQPLDQYVNRIKEIAEMCPFIEGEGVYKARILMEMFSPFDTTYFNACEDEIQNRMQQENMGEENTDFSVSAFPNPANESITFNIESDEDEFELTVFDVTGRVIIDMKLLDSTTSVDLRSFSNGVYSYAIRSESGAFYSGKFSKVEH